VTLAFDVFKDGERFRLAGRVASTLTLTCSRCLEGFPLSVDAGFDLVYVPRALSAEGGEAEIEADDMATAYYDDETIDLAQLVQFGIHLGAFLSKPRNAAATAAAAPAPEPSPAAPAPEPAAAPAAIPTTGADGKPLSKLDMIRKMGAKKS